MAHGDTAVIRGAGWNKVLELDTEKRNSGTEKDQLYYDKSNGYIYIQKTESLIQTNITVNKETPILAENKENKTLSIYIYGERTTFFRYKVVVLVASVLSFSKNNSFLRKMNIWKLPATQILKER